MASIIPSNPHFRLNTNKITHTHTLSATLLTGLPLLYLNFLQMNQIAMVDFDFPLEPLPPPPQYPTLPPPGPPPQPTVVGTAGGNGGFFRRRPKIRVTSEYDSESSVFFHKISCKLLDSLAKLKFSFQNDGKGEISDPQLAFTSKYLSLNYDIEEKNALVNGGFDVGPALQFKATHDVKV